MTTCSLWCTPAELEHHPKYKALQIDPAILGIILQATSDVLYDRSGRRWPGICSDVVRPIHSCHTLTLAPNLRRGRWHNVLPCGCDGNTLRLGGTPVITVTEIRVDGTVVAPSAYRIDQPNLIRRLDDEGWPAFQDLDADPATDDDTFQVSYTYGLDPPAGGKLAAIALAGEYALGWNGDAKCRLPKGTTSVNRQGLSVQIMQAELTRLGNFGLPEVDTWLGAVNPNNLIRRPSVASPDFGRRGVRTRGT